jgi:hypothetical protein
MNAMMLTNDAHYLRVLLDNQSHLTDSLLQINEGLLQYKKSFEIVCDRYEKIGIDYDHGLRGKVKQAFLKIEAFLWKLENNDPAIRDLLQDYQYSLLKLALTEKNFHIKPSQKYVERFKTYLENLLDDLEEDDLLPHAEKQDFSDLINDYAEYFIQLTEALIDLDHSPNSPLITLTHSAHEIQSLVYQVSSRIVDEIINSERGARTYSILIMLCFAFGILSIALVPFLLLMTSQHQPMLLLDERT